MTTKDWIKLHIPEANPAQVTMLEHYIAEREREVDRFEVIDDSGRAYVKGSIYGSPVKVELSYQDDGKTLKVFVTDRPTPVTQQTIKEREA